MAVTLVACGMRAYDVALLELNDILARCAFDVIASAALVAEHSIVRAVGRGRPDAANAPEIRAFDKRTLARLEQDPRSPVSVPVNRPYRAATAFSATPANLSGCNGCGTCVGVRTTGAIHAYTDGKRAVPESCIMCMTCVAACPMSARALPPMVQDGLARKLGALADVRRENKFFI